MIGSSSGHPHSSVRYVGGRNRLSPLASSSRYRSATYRSTGDPSSLRPSSLTRWESSGFRSAGAVSNPAIVSMLARPPRPGQRAASTLGRRRELSANSPASPELDAEPNLDGVLTAVVAWVGGPSRGRVAIDPPSPTREPPGLGRASGRMMLR